MSIQILYQNIITGAVHEITTLVKSATWKTKRSGSPAQLDVTLVEENGVSIVEGGILTLQGEGNLFYGYVFKRSYNEKDEVQITAYDQLRYLKNKDTYVFQGQRADQITAQIAADFGIKTGALENTGYAIPSLVQDNKTLFDIILKALDLTLINTGKMFYLWDDFGSLRISDVAKSVVGLMVGDESLVTAFSYTSDIDSDTANQIKLTKNNQESGKRDVYIVKDSETMGRWGTLQHYKTVDENLNPAQIEAMADALLELKNRPKVTLSLSGISDLTLRAGRSLLVSIGSVGVKGWYIIEEASHDLVQETMTLKVAIV